MVERFPYPQVEKLYSSPLARCIETGAIVYPGRVPVIVEGLHEMDFGVYDGSPAARVKKEFVGFGAGGDETIPIPGGESKEDVAKRMLKAMEGIVADAAKSGCESIAVVGHSLAFSQLFKRCLSPALTRAQAFCPNGMGMLMRLEPEEFMATHRMEYIRGLPEGAKRPDMSLSPYL